MVESKPVEQPTEPFNGTRRVLTWEQLQERLAKQAKEQKRLSELSEAEKAARAKEQAEIAAKEAEIRRAAKAAEAAAAATNPEFKSANSEPISFGSRPKKLTKALLDKRLSKLPGSKSRVKKDVVISLRYYALGLLKSGECQGIAKGGASAVPGMLYVACSDDPTYLRQFPLKEESW